MNFLEAMEMINEGETLIDHNSGIKYKKNNEGEIIYSSVLADDWYDDPNLFGEFEIYECPVDKLKRKVMKAFDFLLNAKETADYIDAVFKEYKQGQDNKHEDPEL